MIDIKKRTWGTEPIRALYIKDRKLYVKEIGNKVIKFLGEYDAERSTASSIFYKGEL